MLNINFSKKELTHLKAKGYYVEQEKDIITVRNIKGKAVGEMIYREVYSIIDEIEFLKYENRIIKKNSNV